MIVSPTQTWSGCRGFVLAAELVLKITAHVRECVAHDENAALRKYEHSPY